MKGCGGPGTERSKAGAFSNYTTRAPDKYIVVADDLWKRPPRTYFNEIAGDKRKRYWTWYDIELEGVSTRRKWVQKDAWTLKPNKEHVER